MVQQNKKQQAEQFTWQEGPEKTQLWTFVFWASTF